MKNKFVLFGLIAVAVIIGVFLILKSYSKNFYDSNLSSNENTAKEIVPLSEEINLLSPEDTSEKRIELLKQIDDFAKESVSGSNFSPEIYSLIKIRLDQTLKEISNTIVPKGQVKIWYIYNMGVIAKSSEKTIAFDLAGTYAYPDMPEFTKHIDVLFITHFHSDHFDTDVVQTALKNGVTIVIPNEKVRLEEDELIKDSSGEAILDYLSGHGSVNFNNLFVAINPSEKTTIKGIEVIGYPANHTGPSEDIGTTQFPLDWYYVNLSGINLLHTGDGTSFNVQPDFTDKNIDVFFTHSTNLDPREKDSLIKLVPNAKIILPLHVLELGHGPDAVNCCMKYQDILDDFSNGYYKTLEGKTRFVPMIWGESILVPTGSVFN